MPVELSATPRGCVLVVCTGNVCRSPFIERLLRPSLTPAGVRVASAGTGALVGAAMDPRAAAQLQAHGGDPAGFVARQITPTLVDEADLVLTATRAHRAAVVAMHPPALRHTFALVDFADLVADLPGDEPAGPAASSVRDVVVVAARRRAMVPPRPAHLADVVDPYGREDALFVAMAEQVMSVLPAVARALAGGA